MTEGAGERPAPDLRLLPAALLGWPAAFWATAAGVRADLWAATIVIFVAAAMLVLLRSRWGRAAPGPAIPLLTSLAVALPAVALVFAVTAATLTARAAGPLPSLIAQSAVIEARGTVTADPHPIVAGASATAFGHTRDLPPRFTVRLHLDHVSGRGRSAASDVPVLVLGGTGWASVSTGQHITVTGRLKAAEPGDDVVALLAAIAGPQRVAAGGWPWRFADRLREGLRQACRGLSVDGGGLLPSLVVGDTSTLPELLRSDLQVAGLTHITAVSGANVAIAAGSVLWVSTALGARRQARLVLAAAMVAAFVVVARPQPSVLRAAVMGGLGLAGLVVARRPRGPAVLSASVVVLLAVDPWLSRSAGFALSCTATGALLLLAPVWARQWARRLPAPLAAALAVPAAAQAACGPLVILLQPTVSVVAVPANLLAEPAVAPATVAGVLAALLGVVWPAAAHVAAWCGSLATGWVALVAHRAAQAPGAALPWPAGVPGALLLAVLTAGLIALSVWPARRPGPQPDRLAARGGARGGGRRGGGRRGPVGRGRGGRAALVAAAVLVAVLVGWVLGPRVPLPGRGAQWPPAGWLVVQCDVGQGDAMVLRSGRDRAVLVDAGPLPGPIDACLRRLGVRHLDLVLLTHDHADHVLGLPGALHGRPVPELVVSPLDEPVENSRLVRQWAAAAGAAVVVGGAGLAGAAGQLPWQVRWQVLAADVPATVARPASVGARDRGPEGADGTRVNESSLVSAWQVSGPGGVIRVIGLGDLEVEGQQRLAARLTDGEVGLGGPVDVVKVAHHGSAKQDPNLYRLLAPRVAVIGVGAGNDYGHPAPSALALLREQGPAVFRTDRSGDIAVQPDADGALGVAAGGS